MSKTIIPQPDWVCLFVDLSGQFIAGQWRKSTDRGRLGMDLKFAYSAEEAVEIICRLPVAVLVVAPNAKMLGLDQVLRTYQDLVGCFTDFQAIVSDDPSPKTLAHFYEFGVDQIFTKQSWQEDLEKLMRETTRVLADEESFETKALLITSQMKHSRFVEAERSESLLGKEDFDYRSAFTRGRIRERAGDYNGASQAFEKARKLNQQFLPSSSKLAETFLVLGKLDEAIEIFEDLEKKNLDFPDRKAILATAYFAKGNSAKGLELITAAESVDPSSPFIKQARCFAALESKDYKEAFKHLDGLSQLGLFMAQRLNNAGIELVRENRVEEALELYKIAHEAVDPSIRYKIDINAALACFKIGQFQTALQHLECCRQDHGRTFDKLERIRKNVLHALKTSSAA